MKVDVALPSQDLVYYYLYRVKDASWGIIFI